MAGQKIKLGSGYDLSNDGKVKRGKKRKQSVSEHIRQKKSKRVRVVRRGTKT